MQTIKAYTNTQILVYYYSATYSLECIIHAVAFPTVPTMPYGCSPGCNIAVLKARDIVSEDVSLTHTLQSDCTISNILNYLPTAMQSKGQTVQRLIG